MIVDLQCELLATYKMSCNLHSARALPHPTTIVLLQAAFILFISQDVPSPKVCAAMHLGKR